MKNKSFWVLCLCLCSSISYAESKCTYSLAPNSLEVGWTGYKTTQKTGVKGKFLKSHTFPETLAAKPSLEALMKAVSVETDLTQVDSGNPVRDQNLLKSFFSLLHSPTKTQGTLKKIKIENDNTGTAVLALRFNGKKSEVPVHFTLSPEGVFKLEGTLDLLRFGAAEALASLNKTCFDLHKGADGISKTWSEAEILVSGKILKSCQ